jgi:hypothetical protein
VDGSLDGLRPCACFSVIFAAFIRKLVPCLVPSRAPG